MFQVSRGGSINPNIHSININVCTGAKPQGHPVLLNSTGADTWHWSDLSGCVARAASRPPLPAQHTGTTIVVHGQEGGVSQESIKGKRGTEGTEVLSRGRGAPFFFCPFKLRPQTMLDPPECLRSNSSVHRFLLTINLTLLSPYKTQSGIICPFFSKI